MIYECQAIGCILEYEEAAITYDASSSVGVYVIRLAKPAVVLPQSRCGPGL